MTAVILTNHSEYDYEMIYKHSKKLLIQDISDNKAFGIMNFSTIGLIGY